MTLWHPHPFSFPSMMLRRRIQLSSTHLSFTAFDHPFPSPSYPRLHLQHIPFDANHALTYGILWISRARREDQIATFRSPSALPSPV